jgi:Zn finger protein HypA/HybF involved in hydrogenase expression
VIWRCGIFIGGVYSAEFEFSFPVIRRGGIYTLNSTDKYGENAIECAKCDEEFSPHKHEMAKGAAIGAAAFAGAKIGGGFGIVSG